MVAFGQRHLGASWRAPVGDGAMRRRRPQSRPVRLHGPSVTASSSNSPEAVPCTYSFVRNFRVSLRSSFHCWFGDLRRPMHVRFSVSEYRAKYLWLVVETVTIEANEGPLHLITLSKISLDSACRELMKQWIKCEVISWLRYTLYRGEQLLLVRVKSAVARNYVSRRSHIAIRQRRLAACVGVNFSSFHGVRHLGIKSIDPTYDAVNRRNGNVETDRWPRPQCTRPFIRSAFRSIAP
jgi:hypothetical protein